jgi:hypothetical protein
MTGMTGRRRAASSPTAGDSRTLRETPRDELPSATAVGELIDTERGAHRASRGDVSSIAVYMRALRHHPVL